MSLVYHDIQRADINGLACIVQGNDTDTDLNLNLSKFPWSIPFGGNSPNAVDAQTGDPEFEVDTAAISVNGAGDVILAVTFAPPPPADNTLGFNVTFLYSSL